MEIRIIQKDRKEGASKFNLRHTLLYAEKGLPDSNIKEHLRRRSICVVIPTYNNGGTIKAVVEKTLCYCDDVIVVADGCTDNTMDILHGIAHITIVSYPQNKGKGHALKMGFRKALEAGFSSIIDYWQ